MHGVAPQHCSLFIALKVLSFSWIIILFTLMIVHNQLHLSTLSKTRVFATLLSLAINNNLKTNCSFLHKYVRSPKAIWEHHKVAIIFCFISAILGTVLGDFWALIKSWFN
jgi:hypothetical protein